MLKRPSIDTQKDVIHNAKGHLLQCERWPFAFLFYCFLLHIIFDFAL